MPMPKSNVYAEEFSAEYWRARAETAEAERDYIQAQFIATMKRLEKFRAAMLHRNGNGPVVFRSDVVEALDHAIEAP